MGLGIQGKEALQAHVCYGQPGILAVAPGQTVPGGNWAEGRTKWNLVQGEA